MPTTAHRGIVSLLLCGALLVSAAACNEVADIDEPKHRPDTGGAAGASASGGAAGTGGATTAGSAGSATMTGGAGTGGAGAGGAPTSSGSGGAGAGGGPTTSGSGGSMDCDMDKDVHLAAGGLCGGDDCDDTNPNVYKGEPAYYSTPKDGANDFDYDCDNLSTPDPQLNVGIAACGSHLYQNDCEAAGEGYLNNMIPACGAAADWGTCKWNGVGCANMKINSIKMPCK